MNVTINRNNSSVVALKYFDRGIKPKFSTGICGRDTCGYGELDQYGYWE